MHARQRLDSIFGTHRVASVEKKGYHLPRSTVTLPDLARLLKSNEIQSVIRPRQARPTKAGPKHNPLNVRPAACMSRAPTFPAEH